MITPEGFNESKSTCGKSCRTNEKWQRKKSVIDERRFMRQEQNVDLV